MQHGVVSLSIIGGHYTMAVDVQAEILMFEKNFVFEQL